jgi:hypothetical protein
MNDEFKVLTLKESLAEWTDWDVAQYHLARSLGLMGPGVRFQLEAKHVFWSENPIGRVLHETLQNLTEKGVLEFDEEEERYRWNNSFEGSWEVK